MVSIIFSIYDYSNCVHAFNYYTIYKIYKNTWERIRQKVKIEMIYYKTFHFKAKLFSFELWNEIISFRRKEILFKKSWN